MLKSYCLNYLKYNKCYEELYENTSNKGNEIVPTLTLTIRNHDFIISCSIKAYLAYLKT